YAIYSATTRLLRHIFTRCPTAVAGSVPHRAGYCRLTATSCRLGTGQMIMWAVAEPGVQYGCWQVRVTGGVSEASRTSGDLMDLVRQRSVANPVRQDLCCA